MMRREEPDGWNFIRPLSERSWDGDYVIYSDAAGQRHRLSALGAEVLRCLVQGEADERELLGRLGLDCGDAVLKSEMVAVLAIFRELGMVRRSAS